MTKCLYWLYLRVYVWIIRWQGKQWVHLAGYIEALDADKASEGMPSSGLS